MDTDFARFVIVRNTFREYMQSCSEFWKAFQRCTIAIKSSEHQRQVLQTHLRLQTLWLERQRLRFEYLLRGGTFGTGFWESWITSLNDWIRSGVMMKRPVS